MLSNIYKISPVFIKHMWVGLFKSARKFLFIFSKPTAIKRCEKQNIKATHFSDFQLKRRYGPLKHFCYAPHTSMFFSLHGKMAPCYATYNEKSDIFQETTIKDSWFKGSFARIREEHAQCRFDENCSFCFELFKNKAFGSMLQQKYEHYAFSRKKYPVIMEFELSNRCNLECIMCDANLSSSIMRKTVNKSQHEDIYDDRFVEQLRDFIPHLCMAEFTGGDPFLIDIYYKIWDLIIDLNPKCDILITTNANTMNARIVNLMAKTKKIHFNISIDAVTKEKYEAIRVNGKFENAVRNIDIFNAYCKKNKTSLNLLVCPMTVNRYEIPELIKFGNEKNIGVFFHTVVKPQNLSLKYQSSAFLDELITYFSSFSFPCKTANEKTNMVNYKNLILLLESWKNENSRIEEVSIEESPANSVYKRLLAEKDSGNLKKTEILMQHFEEKKLIESVTNALNMLDAELLYTSIHQMSIAELINFVENELNKHQTK